MYCKETLLFALKEEGLGEGVTLGDGEIVSLHYTHCVSHCTMEKMHTKCLASNNNIEI